MPKPFGFLPANRLRRAHEFDVVFAHGARLSGVHFVFHYSVTQLGVPRLGVMINKKRCPLAVQRNRLRRVIREQFRLRQSQLLGIDLVVVLKSPFANATEQERFQCLETLFSRLIECCKKSVS